MRGGWTRDDAGLERALAEAVLAAREVPPQFRVAARAAYDWRTLDAELATLARDCATVPWTRRTGREDHAQVTVHKCLPGGRMPTRCSSQPGRIRSSR